MQTHDEQQNRKDQDQAPPSSSLMEYIQQGVRHCSPLTIKTEMVGARFERE